MAGDGDAGEVRGVTKLYRRGARDVVALDRLALTVARGEFLALTGPSGSGKSTVLHLIAGLDVPTRGEIIVDGVSLATLADDALTECVERASASSFSSSTC